MALVLPVPADGRSIFVVPWPGTDRVYIGTTDTDYDGPLDAPTCTAEDTAYLLDAVNARADHHPDRRRRRRLLGRPAAAGRRRRHAGAAPTCPAATG